MMIRNKILLFCFAMLMTSLQSFAVVKPTKLYAYGFAASFNDSTVYITDIMEIDSAWIDVRAKFLYSRNNYSLQLKNHLQGIGVVNPTCIISFAEKRKDAEKKYMKLRRKYTKVPGQFEIKHIDMQQFKFNAISALGDPNVITDYSKASIKAEKKAIKKAKKEEKAKQKELKKRSKKGKSTTAPPAAKNNGKKK